MGITRRYKDTTLEHELTKPCPLMPDGEWHYSKLEYVGGDTLWEVYNSTPLITNTKTGTSLTIALNVDYAFLEVRCTCDTGLLNSEINMQNNNAWTVLTNGCQMYRVIYDSSLTSKLNVGATFYCWYYICKKSQLNN